MDSIITEKQVFKYINICKAESKEEVEKERYKPLTSEEKDMMYKNNCENCFGKYYMKCMEDVYNDRKQFVSNSLCSKLIDEYMSSKTK